MVQEDRMQLNLLNRDTKHIYSDKHSRHENLIRNNLEIEKYIKELSSWRPKLLIPNDEPLMPWLGMNVEPMNGWRIGSGKKE